MSAVWTKIRFILVARDPRSLRGPGPARNRGLRALKADGAAHDSVVLFDDDMAFADCRYQDRAFVSDGVALLGEAAAITPGSAVALGCGYRGRQDLALLDHINLVDLAGDDFEASCERDAIEDEAPGGVTGAFLFVPRRVDQIATFLPGYNEDYFWLRRMQRDGFGLVRSRHSLVHAPRDGLAVSARRLGFEQRGEALWCASHAIARNATTADLCDRIRRSLADRIAELEAAEARLGSPPARPKAAPLVVALRSTVVRLQRLQRTAEQFALESGPSPPIVAELRRVARYCGS